MLGSARSADAVAYGVVTCALLAQPEPACRGRGAGGPEQPRRREKGLRAAR